MLLILKKKYREAFLMGSLSQPLPGAWDLNWDAD